MKPNIDWVIHGCANGVVCEIDGKQKTDLCLEPVISILTVWEDTTTWISR